MGFGRSSCWAKLALISVFLGTVLDIAGYTTTSWLVYASTDGNTKVNLGLWTLTVCNATTCTTVPVTDVYATAMFNAMRILETLGVIMAAFLVFFILIYTCMDGVRTQNMARTAMVLCFVTGMVIFVAMCLCLAYVPPIYVVGFSLGLTVLGYLLILIAGSLLIPDSYREDDDDYDDYYSNNNNNNNYNNYNNRRR